MKKIGLFVVFCVSLIISGCTSEREIEELENVEKINGAKEKQSEIIIEEGLNPNDVLLAFQNAGLAATNPRDNTHNGCPVLKCVGLITTEDVSIYSWPNKDKAAEYVSKSTLPSAQRENITIRMNWSHLDITPYFDVLNGLVK